MKILLPLLLSLLTVSAPAALVTFQFDTTVDATALGGDFAMPLSLVYTFDTGRAELPPVRPGAMGSSLKTLVSTVVRLGPGTAFASGGNVSAHNFNSDGYSMFPGPFSGSLLGREIDYLFISLTDTDGAMFDYPHHPLTADFAKEADYQQVNIHFSDGARIEQLEFQDTPAGERTPFRLQTVPEPTASALTGLSIGALALRRSRRR